MAFADTRRTESAAHKYTFRVSSIDGSTVRVLWEGDGMGEAENQAEAFALAARAAGSRETIALDSFRLDIERRWCERHFVSRAPSVIPLRRSAGTKGRPKILYMPLEFPTWTSGGHSWSYAASLAYVEGLKSAGCEVTTINTACAPYHRKILREMRFDQVWIHCHPRHLADFSFRQWIGDIAPVRVLLCGESLTYPAEQVAAEPWSASHTRTFELWAPFITHAACVDPADLADSRIRAMHWAQAVPAKMVRSVNRRPRLDRAVFVGTLYPPRDRWAWELAELLERVASPESPAFEWLFERSHEWIQRAYDRTQLRAPWWRLHALEAYNRLQIGLRKHAFRNFLSVLREGVATVSLPSMVRTYSGRVVEGMAAGRPVITQRLPGHPEVFHRSEILHYETVDELADHVRRLQREPETANDIARAARAAILQYHTVEKRTAEMLRFVEGGV